MTKLTLQSYWQPEDGLDAVISRWIKEENAKIPADIRENLRGLFPQIGISPDEADLVPESVAQYITTNSAAYQKYIKNRQNENVEKSAFTQKFLARLQALYVKLEFYAAFVETVQLAKHAGSFYVKSCSAKIYPGLLKGEADLRPKTQEEEQLLSLIVEVEKALTMFESIVPVEVARYIGYDSHEIPSDTLGTYLAVEEMTSLADLKKQAETLFCTHGYVQTGKNSFAPKEVAT